MHSASPRLVRQLSEATDPQILFPSKTDAEAEETHQLSLARQNMVTQNGTLTALVGQYLYRRATN